MTGLKVRSAPRRDTVLWNVVLCLTLAAWCAEARAQKRSPEPVKEVTEITTNSDGEIVERTTEAPADAEADEPVTDEEARRAVRSLSDSDPQRRQEGAETLARRASVEHRRLVAGYRLQERDPRVRLALDWALYRIGKPDALFGIVDALTTPRRAQAIDYLARLDDPSTLVALLNSPKRGVKTGVLEALGRAGDERTAERLEPLVASSDLDIASAAQLAISQIETRLGKRAAAPAPPSRPRRARTSSEVNPY